MNLLIGDTVDVQQRGELQASIAVSRTRASRSAFEIEGEYGMSDRAQLTVAVEEEQNGSVDKTFTLALGIGLLCEAGSTAMRLDVGVTHQNETEGYARLVAGGPFLLGSWHAGASHGTSDATRSYFGAAVLQNDFTPLSLEAKRESDGTIWKTLFSAGLYLYTSDTVELAFGLAQLGDSEDPRRRLMLKLSGEF